VEFGSLAENHLANRYSQLVEFVTTITEDGDMPIITLFSEAIHPNNMVTMLWCLCLVKSITKDSGLLCPILAVADFTVYNATYMHNALKNNCYFSVYIKDWLSYLPTG